MEQKLDSYNMLHCRNCDLVFADPMSVPVEFYAEDPDYVLRDTLILDPLEWERRWDIDEFLSAPHSGGNLLDIGCGTGFFVSRAKKLGYDAYGIEFNERSVDRGRSYFDLDSLYALDLNGLRSKFPDLRFDTITMFQVLEHLEAPNAIMDEIKSVLKPDGRLVLSLPWRGRWPDLLGDVDCPPHHLTRWSREALESFLSRAGFKIKVFKVEPFPPDSMLGLAYKFVLRFAPSLTMRGQGVGGKASGMSSQEVVAQLNRRKAKMVFARAAMSPVWAVMKMLGARGPHLYAEAFFSD